MERVKREQDRPTVKGTFMGYHAHRPSCKLLKGFGRIPAVSITGQLEFYPGELKLDEVVDWAEYHAPGFEQWLGLRYAIIYQHQMTRLQGVLDYRDNINTQGSPDYKVAVEIRAYAALYEMRKKWDEYPELQAAFLQQRARMPEWFPIGHASTRAKRKAASLTDMSAAASV